MSSFPKIAYVLALSSILGSTAFAQSGSSAGTSSLGVGTGAGAGTSGNIGGSSAGAGARTGASIGTIGSTGAASTASSVNTGVSAGTGTATNTSWDAENIYWRDNYPKRTYYNKDRDYSVYAPAYRYGVDMYNRTSGKVYSDISQEEMRRGWEQARGDSSLSWDDAQLATRDAYTRMYNNTKP